MSYILFPVGDSSGDGHAYNAYFLVQSNKTVKDTQLAYAKYHHLIGVLCDDYQENFIDKDELIDICLKKENSSPKEVESFLHQLCTDYRISIESEEDVSIYIIDTPEKMIYVWISLLNWLESDLNLKIISQPLSNKDISSNLKIASRLLLLEDDDSLIADDYLDSMVFRKQHNIILQCPGYGVWNDCSSSEFYMNCN